VVHCPRVHQTRKGTQQKESFFRGMAVVLKVADLYNG